MTQTHKTTKVYIYKITNTLNDKIYIGLTVNIKGRWSKHKHAAKSGLKGKCFYLHRSINKYGVQNFTIEEIEVCRNITQATRREKYWIQVYKSNNSKYGMNLTDGGEGTPGLRRCGTANPFYGKKHTDETKQLISRAHKGKKLTQAHKRKLINSITGENNRLSVLQEGDVTDIVHKYISGAGSSASLAKQYGVSKRLVLLILSGRAWTHVTSKLSQDIVNKIELAKETNIHNGAVKAGRKNGFYGKKHTEESRRKMSQKKQAQSGGRVDPRSGIKRDDLRGEKNKTAKLTNRQAKEIRDKYMTGRYFYADLEREYNISKPAVQRLLANKTYADPSYIRSVKRRGRKMDGQ